MVAIKESAVIKITMAEERLSERNDFKWVNEPVVVKRWWGSELKPLGWYEEGYTHYGNRYKWFKCETDEQLVEWFKKSYLFKLSNQRIVDKVIYSVTKPNVIMYMENKLYNHQEFETNKEALKFYEKWRKKLKLTKVDDA